LIPTLFERVVEKARPLKRMIDVQAIKVFFFGDSICFGQGISLHKGWVPRVSAKLDKVAQDHDRKILVVNSSVNGRTTRQALEHMPYEIQSHQPDVLIVQFGMNDCNYWETDGGNPRVSPKAFAANLEEIVTRACTFGAKKVLLNTNHPTGRDECPMLHTNVTYQQSNEQYNEIIRQVAADLGSKIILNDMESVFRACASNRDQLLRLLLPDQLHPSEAGHDLYFEIIQPRIEKVILQLIAEEPEE
jgi:acyl-CoA thioesterase-1